MTRLTAFRGLVPRIVGATAVITLVSVLGYALLYTYLVFPVRNEYFIQLTRKPIERPRELADCAANPATWVWDQGARVYPYHARTGLSRNPDAPPLRRDLLADDREVHIVRERLHSAAAVTGVWRTGNEGECGIMQFQFVADNALETRIRAVFGLIALGSILFVTLTVFLTIVRPILAALHRLRLTATQVGSDSFQPVDTDRDDEIGEIGRTLAAAHAQIMADKAEIARRKTVLERFTADIAHDVRTPLASLKLTLSSLHGHPDKELRAALSRAAADVVYLASLTQNLRLASQLAEQGAADSPKQTFDLDQLTDRVTERQRIFAEHRAIQLEWLSAGGPVWISGDPTHMEQAVSNLVENAITYGKEGGQVIVALRTEEGRFELLVEDDGPGVSSEELPRLAERYFRAEGARSRQKPGSGLGLSITRQVCDRAGFDLRFAHAEPTGLSITVSGSVAQADPTGACGAYASD